MTLLPNLSINRTAYALRAFYGYVSAKQFFPLCAEVDSDGTNYNVIFKGANAQPNNPADA
jgi:hypothetical protein